jgi:hypothetical protein
MCGLQTMSALFIEALLVLHMMWQPTDLLGGRASLESVFSSAAQRAFLMATYKDIGERDMYNLLTLLKRFGGQQSAKPEDRVYGLLGVATDAREYGPVDYSAPVQDVYAQFARATIQSSSSLDVLCMAGLGIMAAGRGQVKDLPSWVPDWTNPFSEFDDAFKNAAASRGMPVANARRLFGPDSNPKILQGRGVEYDVVSDMIFDIPQANHPDGRSDWKRLVDSYGSQPYKTGIPPLQAIYRTLFGFSTSEAPWEMHRPMASFLSELGRHLPPREEEEREQKEKKGKGAAEKESPSEAIAMECLAHFLRWMGQDRAGRSDEAILEPFMGTPDSPSRMMNWDRLGNIEYNPLHEGMRQRMVGMAGRVLFRTAKNGLIGHAYPGIRRGDRVCVLFGCSAPVILRQVEDHYVLLGPSWVLGMMEGEVMKEYEKGKLEMQEFSIW